MMTNQAGEEQAAEWPAEDIAWLETIPAALKGVAKRHGRRLFQRTMQAGAIQHAMQIILSQTSGNRAVGQAMRLITSSVNDLTVVVLKAEGFGVENLLACRRDIELVAALAEGQITPGLKKSPGGIILNS